MMIHSATFVRLDAKRHVGVVARALFQFRPHADVPVGPRKPNASLLVDAGVAAWIKAWGGIRLRGKAQAHRALRAFVQLYAAGDVVSDLRLRGPKLGAALLAPYCFFDSMIAPTFVSTRVSHIRWPQGSQVAARVSRGRDDFFIVQER